MASKRTFQVYRYDPDQDVPPRMQTLEVELDGTERMLLDALIKLKSIDPTLRFESRRMRAGAGFAQRYLKRVLYGNSRPLSHAQPPEPANQWRFEVVFDYGEHGGAGLPTP